MLSLMAMLSMLMGSFAAPASDLTDEEPDGDSSDDDYATGDMSDGGLLSDAAETAPNQDADAAEDTGTAQTGTSQTGSAQDDDTAAVSAQPDTVPEPEVTHHDYVGTEAQQAGAKDTPPGLLKKTGTLLDPGLDDVPDPLAGLTDKDIIKDLREELKAAKGSLDKDTLKSLRDELKALKGSAGSDVLTADAVDSFLEGLEGDDRLVGGAGSDLLEGGDNNDSLRASEGGDIMLGGAGSDILMGVETSYDPSLGLHQYIHAKGGPSQDILDGGDGDDVLRMGRGDIGIGGAGADMFFVQGDIDDRYDDIVPQINDFSPEEDDLVIAIPYTEAELIESWPDMPDRHYEIETRDFEDGTGATVYVNGQIMAHVTGAQGINPGDIRVVGNEMVGANWFDISHGVQSTDTWWHGIENDASAMAIRAGGGR